MKINKEYVQKIKEAYKNKFKLVEELYDDIDLYSDKPEEYEAIKKLLESIKNIEYPEIRMKIWTLQDAIEELYIIDEGYSFDDFEYYLERAMTKITKLHAEYKEA